MISKFYEICSLEHICRYVIKRSNEVITRLNSGTRNQHYFFIVTSFLYRNIESDSVDHAESGDIKILIKFLGNSLLKFLLNIWNLYVGCSHMRGVFTIKIIQYVNCFKLVIFIYHIGDILGTLLLSTYLATPIHWEFSILKNNVWVSLMRASTFDIWGLYFKNVRFWVLKEWCKNLTLAYYLK